MPKGYHHVTLDIRSQIWALKATRTSLHKIASIKEHGYFLTRKFPPARPVGLRRVSEIALLVKRYKATIEAMLSPSRIFMMRTPWVARERIDISATDVRITCPFFETTTSSSSSM